MHNHADTISYSYPTDLQFSTYSLQNVLDSRHCIALEIHGGQAFGNYQKRKIC